MVGTHVFIAVATQATLIIKLQIPFIFSVYSGFTCCVSHRWREQGLPFWSGNHQAHENGTYSKFRTGVAVYLSLILSVQFLCCCCQRELYSGTTFNLKLSLCARRYQCQLMKINLNTCNEDFPLRIMLLKCRIIDYQQHSYTTKKHGCLKCSLCCQMHAVICCHVCACLSVVDSSEATCVRWSPLQSDSPAGALVSLPLVFSP